MMQEAQGLGLDRPAQKEVFRLERIGQFGDQRVAHFVLRAAIDDQSEGPVGIMLADQNDGAMKEGPLQPPVVQDELAFQRFHFRRHFAIVVSGITLRQACPSCNLVYNFAMRKIYCSSSWAQSSRSAEASLKPLQPGATDVGKADSRGIGIVLKRFDHSVHFDHELVAQTGLLVVVPFGCAGDVSDR